MKRIKKGVILTQTSQPHTCALLNNEGKDLTKIESEKDMNVKLLLSLCDSLNELHDKLSRLSHIMEKKIREQDLSMEGK